MNARILLLAFLNSRDASGYEIKKLSEAGQFKHFVDISFGSIYPTLARLEKEGLVACREETQSGKPDRKVYSITEAGKDELKRGLSEPPQRDRFKSEFLLLAANAEIAGEAAVTKALADRIAWLEEDIAMLEMAKQECSGNAKCWVIGYGLHIMRTDLEYLKQNHEGLLQIAEHKNAVTEAAE